MKASWITWWVVNIFWIVTFIGLSIFIWIRNVDASGVHQTYEAKMIAFIVLLAFYILPLIIQIIWMVINIVISKKSKN